MDNKLSGYDIALLVSLLDKEIGQLSREIENNKDDVNYQDYCTEKRDVYLMIREKLLK